MSDNRNVARDTMHRENTMNAVAETYHYLNELTKRAHRGRHDTWSAARDRVAKEAGVARSYCKRVWDRYSEMKDVSGNAYRALRASYERQCIRNEEAAEAYRAERLAMKEPRDGVVDDEQHQAGVAANSPASRKAA